MSHTRRGMLALTAFAAMSVAGCGGSSSSSNTSPTAGAQQHALTELAKLHGRAYVEASKALPDQIETR